MSWPSRAGAIYIAGARLGALFIGAALMIGGGIIAAFLGVHAEGESLENIAKPLIARASEPDDLPKVTVASRDADGFTAKQREVIDAMDRYYQAIMAYGKGDHRVARSGRSERPRLRRHDWSCHRQKRVRSPPAWGAPGPCDAGADPDVIAYDRGLASEIMF